MAEKRTERPPRGGLPTGGVPAGTLLVAAWLLASARDRPRLLVAGLLLALLAGVLFRRLLPPPAEPRPRARAGLLTRLRRAAWTLAFLPRFGVLVLRSGLHIARLALKRDLDFWPGIVRIKGGLPHRRATTVFAHLITLTPGTVAMDYNEETDDLYVHWIDVGAAEGDDLDRQAGGSMRPWVRRMFE